MFGYIKDKLNLKKERLYKRYTELSTTHIGRNYCKLNYNDITPIKIYIFEFLERTDPKYFDLYHSCDCDFYKRIKRSPYEPNIDIFINACKKEGIEKSECISMFDLERVKSIDEHNANKLTSMANTKILKNKEFLKKMSEQRKKEENNDRGKKNINSGW
jgi:hypothetical protein